jgi:hypothetical protein
VDVIPVSDPNAATMSQKVVQYQAVLQLAQQAPQLYDMAKLHRQMLDVLGIKNAEKLVKLEEDKKPEDPITENMNALNMKPIKAFYYQDHEAHIKVHMNAMQDPKLAQIVGQNPNAQAIQAAMLAHINEHLGFGYKKQMEQLIGMSLPQDEDEDGIPKEMEVQISQMASQASDMLLQRNQNEIAAQQAQQAAQDPVVQMQIKEQQLEEQELQRKAAKDQADAAAKAEQLQVERERIASQERIAAEQLAAKLAKDEEELRIKQQGENFKMAQGIFNANRPVKKGE